MNDEESREAYWKIVFQLREYIEESGRSTEDVLEELNEDC